MLKRTPLARGKSQLSKGKGFKQSSQSLQGSKSGLKKSGKIKAKPMDPKFLADRKLQQEKDREFYTGIWNNRERKCIGCGEVLYGEISTGYFDHCIPKSTHPELRYVEENIAVVCLQCHSAKENGYAKIPHQEQINKLKEKYNI